MFETKTQNSRTTCTVNR